MKFYLYYSFGSCNDGDHSFGLKEFNTLLAALQERHDLRDCYGEENVSQIIEGKAIEVPDG